MIKEIKKKEKKPSREVPEEEEMPEPTPKAKKINLAVVKAEVEKRVAVAGDRSIYTVQAATNAVLEDMGISRDDYLRALQKR